jgi:hypothetical protein
MTGTIVDVAAAIVAVLVVAQFRVMVKLVERVARLEGLEEARTEREKNYPPPS